MNRRSPIPGEARAYRVAELRVAGVAPDRLAATDIRRVGRGIVLHPDSPLDPSKYRDRCLAVAMSLKQKFFISRRSAAALYGIPAPLPLRGAIEVGSFAPLRAPVRAGITGHRVRTGVMLWAEQDGITLPHPADVWCLLSAVLTPKELVIAGDFLVSGSRILGSGGHRTDPLASMADLTAADIRHQRSTGSARRANALPLLRAPVDSPSESELRWLIVGAGFDEPIVNCAVPVATRILHADLGYPALRIAIEYEGAHHFSTVEQARRDVDRHEQMRAAGWYVLRVTAHDLRHPEAFLGRLAQVIRERTQ